MLCRLDEVGESSTGASRRDRAVVACGSSRRDESVMMRTLLAARVRGSGVDGTWFADNPVGSSRSPAHYRVDLT